MMKTPTLAALGIICSLPLLAQTSTSDCNGAIQLCGGVYTESSAPLGTGNVYEFTGTCNLNLESASLWYVFTVQADGNLSFVLDPANDADDYDWGMFNITEGGCAGINAQDGSSPEIECNSYGTFFGNGQTGISTANGGTGTTNGPGDTNGPPFNADLPVQVGQTYALVVMNWTGSPDGYNIDFTQSTASIYDDTLPTIDTVTTDCSNHSFVVTFSEPIITNTVSPSDFTLTSPTGTVYTFGSMMPIDPGASAQTGFTLGLNGSPSEGGDYTFTVTSAAGNVEDLCGNTVVDSLFTLPIVLPFSYIVAFTTACNGTGGGLQATYGSGGEAPIVFTLDGTLLPNGAASGLNAGGHTLTVSDAAGCQIIDQLTVPDHVLQVDIPQDQDSLSCSMPSVTIAGVTVQPEQVVHYAWTAVTGGGTDSSFSTSAAPVVNQAGTYSVVVTDPVTGCTDDAVVAIHPNASGNLDLTSMKLPNVVSPNGDGKNDVWRPFLPADPAMNITFLFDTYALTVFDRWGGTVYETGDGGQRSWNPQDVNDGTYFYTLAYRAECGAVVDGEVSGSITVLR